MTVLQWDQPGQRTYETGVDKGVLYIPTAGVYDTAIPWNGLSAVTESPSGAEANAIYADNAKYLNLVSAEEFGGTIEAYTYPDAFGQCDGTASPQVGLTVSQQTRKTFGLAYRSRLGNDLSATDYGYKLHLVYGALAAPSEKAYATINDKPEGIVFKWAFTTTPVPVTNLKPSALLVVDSSKVSAANLLVIENAIFGTAGTNARLPLPDEIITMLVGSQTIVTATAPTFVPATGVITVPTVVGVTYRRTDTNAIVTATATIVASGDSLVIRATPASGAYALKAMTDDDWSFTKP